MRQQVGPSSTPSFSGGPPNSLGVHLVRLAGTPDNPGTPKQFSYWNGKKWGRLVASPLEARPADNRGRPRSAKLLHCAQWVDKDGSFKTSVDTLVPNAAVSSEIMGFLRAKGPQSFDVIVHGIAGLPGELLTRGAVDVSLRTLVDQGDLECKAGYAGQTPDNFFCLPVQDVGPVADVDEAAVLVEEVTRSLLLPDSVDAPAAPAATLAPAVAPTSVQSVSTYILHDADQVDVDLELLTPILRACGPMSFASLMVEWDLRHPDQPPEPSRLADSLRAGIMLGLVKLTEVSSGSQLSYVSADAVVANSGIYLARPSLPAIALEALVFQLLAILRVNPPLRPLVLLDRLTHLFPQNTVTSVGVRAAIEHCVAMGLVVPIEKAYAFKVLAPTAEPQFRVSSEGLEIRQGQSSVVLSAEHMSLAQAVMAEMPCAQK